MKNAPVRLAAALAALLTPSLAHAQDVPDVGKLIAFIRWGGVFISLFVVLGAFVLLRLVGGAATRMAQRFTGRRLFISKLESVVQFLVYIATASLVIGLSIELDPTAMTVIGGALAFAVGFAMRDLVAAFIAGITIMFDRPFQVGDRVEYAGQYGDVIKVGLRSVQINTLDHNIVTVPNNKVLTDVVSCGNYGALEMQVGMDVYVGADQDVRRAAAIVREACLTSRYCFLDEPVPIALKQTLLGDLVVFHIKARPYVLDTKYEKAFETDVHLRVAEAFAKEGILPPALLHRNAPGVSTKALAA